MLIWVGTVWRRPKAGTLTIECGGERIVRYEIDELQYQDMPRPIRPVRPGNSDI